jgi:hypothetical protein
MQMICSKSLENHGKLHAASAIADVIHELRILWENSGLSTRPGLSNFSSPQLGSEGL